MGARQARLIRAVRAAVAVVPLLVVAAPSAEAGTIPVAISLATADGAGTSVTPGRSCADGGTGAYWHYDYGAKVATNKFSKLDTESRIHLDVHSDTTRFPNTGGVYPSGPNPAGFLQGTESHLSFLNQRGSVKLRLQSGTCAAPTLTFDGSIAAGSGTWSLDSGTGSYRDISPTSGTFALQAGVDPGADNPLSLTLAGTTFSVPNPGLKLEVVKTYWGGLGTDYLTRRATVIFKVTNNGQGDAFGALLQLHSSPTAGVTPMGPVPQTLFDIPAGGSQIVQVRYQLGLLSGPCKLLLLGCSFNASATVLMHDAFDNPLVLTATVPTKAPNLPPPL